VTFEYNDGNGNLTDVIDSTAVTRTLFTNSVHELDQCLRSKLLRRWQRLATVANGLVNTYYSTGQIHTQQDQLGPPPRRLPTQEIQAPQPAGRPRFSIPRETPLSDTYQYGLLTEETQGYGTPAAATWQYFYDPFTTAALE